MRFLPVCLKIENSRILVVGGGHVAEQKVRNLLPYTSAITVVAPRVLPEIVAAGVTVRLETYRESLLEGFRLVYACTDARDLNRSIRNDAHRRGILVCCADDPDACDFVSPAIHRRDAISVAVSSDATDVKRAVAWRDAIRRLDEEGRLP